MPLSGLPALDVTVQDFGSLPERMAAQSLLPSKTAAAEADYNAEAQMAPLKVAAQRREDAAAGVEANNQAMAQVAMDAQAADPADRPTIWDNGMRDAAAKGVKNATQYIGHYRDDLAERVGDIYGGGKGAKTKDEGLGMPDPAEVQRQVAQMPAPQLKTALGNLNRVISSFNKVAAGGEQAWNDELQVLKEAGVDTSAFLPSTEWNPLNYAAAAKRIKSLAVYRDAMAERAAITGVGGVPAQPKPEGTWALVGTEPGTNKPIYHNTVTNAEKVGDHPVGPKPTAAISTFMFKQQAAKDLGLTGKDALDFANGVRAVPRERLMAVAIAEANRQLGDASLAGEDIPNPDEWVRQKTQENFTKLTASAAAPAPAGPAGGGGGGALPQRAVDAVQKAGGKPVTFQNGQVFRWDAATKKPVRVR